MLSLGKSPQSQIWHHEMNLAIMEYKQGRMLPAGLAKLFGRPSATKKTCVLVYESV